MISPVSRPDPVTPRLVLLVDRDDDTRQMYAEYLRCSNLQVEEADDGRKALAMAISLRPAVIVTETRLPGIDGYELCGLLRRDPATRTTAIVIVTGDAYRSGVERATAASADVVLVKPCLPEVLLGKILELMQPISKAARLPSRTRSTPQKARSRTFERRDTTDPPMPVPMLVCPACDRALLYMRSHVGGVSERHQEQWDYFDCPAGCGEFQYRQRTRALRKVS